MKKNAKPMRVWVVMSKAGRTRELAEFRRDAVAQAKNWDNATPFASPHRVVEFVEVCKAKKKGKRP